MVHARSAIAAASFALVASIFGSTLQSPSKASACSLVGLSARELSALVERTPVIAIGTWIDAGEYEAVFVVDESLKGTTVGARHKFDNRQTYTQVACSPYDEDFHSGFRFKAGQRSLVFMEQEVDGLWQIGWSSYAAFNVSTDDLAPMPMWPGSGSPVLLEDVLRSIHPDWMPPIADPAILERSLGCHPPNIFNPEEAPSYAMIAESGAVLLTILSSPPLTGETTSGRVTARIDEILAGDLEPGGTITLNDHWISDGELGDCDPQVESGRRGLQEGVQYLAYLRPDEFGVAEFRPAAWGKAIVSVNEKYLTGDQPTLAGIRRLTGSPGPAVAPTATAEGEPVEAASSIDIDEDSGDFDWLPVGLAATVVLAVTTAAWFVVRRRRPSA